MDYIKSVFEKIKIENYSLYVILLVGIIFCGILFYMKVADFIHNQALKIGKTLAR